MTKPITKTYELEATPAEVFEALTKPNVIQKWSGAPATMDNQVGTEFSLFGGEIVGKNVEVVPNQKLVQDWRPKAWETSSKVTFSLAASNGGTRLDLRHENVPDDEREMIDQGWDAHYLGQMQKMFAE